MYQCLFHEFINVIFSSHYGRVRVGRRLSILNITYNFPLIKDDMQLNPLLWKLVQIAIQLVKMQVLGAIQSYAELYRAIQSYTKVCRAIQSYTGINRAAYRDILSCT